MAADSGSRSWKTNIFWTKDQDNPNERIIKLHMPGVIFDPRFNVKTPMVRKPVHMLKPRCASLKKKTFHSVEKRQVLKETNSPANLSNGNPGSAAFSQYGSGDNKFVKVHKRSKEQLSLKELNPQDKKRVANLVKELAKVGEERVNAEERLQTERKAFEERLVILQEEYDAVLKEKQYLKKRFLELQALLVKYQVNGRISSPLKPVQAREDKENQKMLVALSSPKQKDVSPPGSVLTQFPGNTRPANTGSATEDTTTVKFTKQPHLRSQAISSERSDSLVPLNNTMQSGCTHEKTTRKTNSGHCPHETEEPIRDKVNSSGDRFESAGTSTEAGYAVALQCQSQEIAQNSHFGDEVHLHAINPQEETPNSVSSRDRPRSDTTSQPAVHPGPAAMISQIPLQTKAVIPGVGDDVDNGQLPPRKNEDRSFSEMSEISGHFSAELDAVYRLYCREYELQLQLQQQQIELQKQQLQLQQQLQQVEALQQKQEQQRQQDEGQFKEQPQHFKPEKKQQEQRQGQEAVGQTSPMQGVTRVSVKSDETIKQGVIEKMPSSTLVPGLSSKLLQVSPARSLVTTLEGSSSVPSNSRPDMVPVPVPVEGISSEGPGLPPSEIQGMEQQRGIGVPAVINRAVSAPLSVRPAWSDVQHQLHSRRQKDYAFRNTVPIDHDSNCSGLLPDFSKYIAYEHRPTASRPSDEKESNDMNCSGALPSRYSLYSHSRNALSRGSGRESSRLIYPSSNYAASSEGNVSKTELEPYVLFYKGLTARNHSPISDFPMAESMERHCVAKYQHSADESASHILSEDGLRSFKDCRVEESGERVPLDSSAYPFSLLDIVDGLENIAGEQGECCRSQELTEGLDTTDSGYSQDTNKGRGPLTPEIVSTDEEEAAVLEDIFFRPLGRL